MHFASGICHMPTSEQHTHLRQLCVHIKYMLRIFKTKNGLVITHGGQLVVRGKRSNDRG